MMEDVARILFMAIFCTTRADMGKAEIPAAPIIGLDFFFAEQIQHLGKNDSADGIEHKTRKADDHDEQRVKADKGICAHAEGNGDAQQQGDQVGKRGLCCFGKIAQYAAFPE